MIVLFAQEENSLRKAQTAACHALVALFYKMLGLLLFIMIA